MTGGLGGAPGRARWAKPSSVCHAGLRFLESRRAFTHLWEAHGACAQERTTPLTITGLAQADALLPPAAGSSSDADPLIAAILESLDDAKAEDVVAIDLRSKTTLADHMVIATGRSSTHVGAIADRLLRACKTMGLSPKSEGLQNCDWVLVDAGDAIVHVFRPEVRQFYNLEKMWGGSRPEERRAG